MKVTVSYYIKNNTKNYGESLISHISFAYYIVYLDESNSFIRKIVFIRAD